MRGKKQKPSPFHSPQRPTVSSPVPLQHNQRRSWFFRVSLPSCLPLASASEGRGDGRPSMRVRLSHREANCGSLGSRRSEGKTKRLLGCRPRVLAGSRSGTGLEKDEEAGGGRGGGVRETNCRLIVHAYFFSCQSLAKSYRSKTDQEVKP